MQSCPVLLRWDRSTGEGHVYLKKKWYTHGVIRGLKASTSQLLDLVGLGLVTWGLFAKGRVTEMALHLNKKLSEGVRL